MAHYFVHLPIVTMREKPTHASQVVSQALFGEEALIREKRGGWVGIETPDRYFGWVMEGSFVERTGPYPRGLEVTRLMAHVYATPEIEFGPLMTLPFGSPLEELDRADSRWVKVKLVDGKEGFIQKGDVVPERSDLVALSRKFLGLPYTWGGRSSFGFDCSGFVQMLMGRAGVALPRDAREQIAHGQQVEEAQAKDLLFWGKSATAIKHVGMVLDPPYFIHASSRENQPYVRVSSWLDAEWRGGEGAYYPYRTARRLVSENPKEKKGHGDLGAQKDEKTVKVAIDKNLDFLAPHRHRSPNEREAN